jgi:hypothetical protein
VKKAPYLCLLTFLWLSVGTLSAQTPDEARAAEQPKDALCFGVPVDMLFNDAGLRCSVAWEHAFNERSRLRVAIDGSYSYSNSADSNGGEIWNIGASAQHRIFFLDKALRPFLGYGAYGGYSSIHPNGASIRDTWAWSWNVGASIPLGVEIRLTEQCALELETGISLSYARTETSDDRNPSYETIRASFISPIFSIGLWF